jgi:hypothetical protein
MCKQQIHLLHLTCHACAAFIEFHGEKEKYIDDGDGDESFVTTINCIRRRESIKMSGGYL